MPLSVKEQQIVQSILEGNLSPRERQAVLMALKQLAKGKTDIVEQLRFKSVEAQVRLPNERSASLFDFEPARRIPPMWEFMESREYMGLSKILYPRVLDILVAADDPKVRKVVICAGKGVGKSTICGAMMSRGAFLLNSYPNVRDIFGTLPDDYIVVLNMSISATQAQKVIFQKLKSMIEHASCFKGAGVHTREIEFANKVMALSGHSGYQVFYGYDVFYGCVDEASHFEITPDHDVIAEIVEGIESSQLTRFPLDYKLLIISSPKDDQDYVVKGLEDIKTKGEEVRIFRGDSNTDIKDVTYEEMGAWKGVPHA